MHLSVDELRSKVEKFRESGLNTQQIADELSLSHTTVQWLSASDYEVDEKPLDVKVGWRSIAVKGERIETVSYIFCDIIEEMVGDEVDTIVGVSINGIAFAQAISLPWTWRCQSLEASTRTLVGTCLRFTRALKERG